MSDPLDRGKVVVSCSKCEIKYSINLAWNFVNVYCECGECLNEEIGKVASEEYRQ